PAPRRGEGEIPGRRDGSARRSAAGARGRGQVRNEPAGEGHQGAVHPARALTGYAHSDVVSKRRIQISRVNAWTRNSFTYEPGATASYPATTARGSTNTAVRATQ